MTHPPGPPHGPPAGWYPATEPGQERWWDGRSWTQHVRTRPRIVWGGNAEASLVVGLVCAVGAAAFALLFVIALVTGGGWEALMLLFGVAALGTFAWVGIANSRGVRRRHQAPTS